MIVRQLFLFLIRSYQYFISPLMAQHCRYYPSCSSYAYTAVHAHGIVKGGGLALKRLLRCHPWSAGGYDPVPDVPKSAAPCHCPSHQAKLP